MITAVQQAGFPDPSATDSATRPAPTAATPEPKAPPPETEPNVRLTIDAATDGPYFVYTLQDRSTGRIIAQLPRHAVEALGGRPDYEAGDMVRAKA